MNRTQRRAAARAANTQRDSATAAVNRTGRLPIFGCDGRIIGAIGVGEARHFRAAANASVLPDRVILTSLSDDTGIVGRRGNPRRYSHDHETDQNPRGCWMMRRLGSNHPATDAFVRRVFMASVLDNLTNAA